MAFKVKAKEVNLTFVDIGYWDDVNFADVNSVSKLVKSIRAKGCSAEVEALLNNLNEEQQQQVYLAAGQSCELFSDFVKILLTKNDADYTKLIIN